MSKLIIFGCSLSADGHITSWPQRISEVCNIEYLNFAVPASSNQVQIQRFKDYVLDNEINKDDIIIWQITGTERYFKRTQVEDTNQSTIFNNNRKNYFDDNVRYDLLCHHPNNRNLIFDEEKIDVPQLLEDLLFFFTMARKLANLVIVVGWKNALLPEHSDKFFKILNDRGFDYVSPTILEHSIENNLPLMDTSHPGEQGYISFADNCVIPKLKELKLL